MCVCSVLSLPLSAGGINPLLLNSLFGGMDLSSLQSLQSLQLAAGLMAFPPPTDPKQSAANAAAASMLPLMLPGMGGLPNMAALPNMFSLGGLFAGNLATASAAPSATNSTVTTAVASNGTMEAEGADGEETAKRKRGEKDEDDGDEVLEDEQEARGNEEGLKTKKRKMEGESGSEGMQKSAGDGAVKLPAADSSTDVSINGDAAALLAAAGMSANSLAFNPFLISTMAPGLLYPSMFLPPGLGGLSLPGFPAASTLAELQSAMAGALGGSASTPTASRDEEEEEEEDKKGEAKAAAEEEEEEAEEEDEDAQGGGQRDLAEGETSGEAERPTLEEKGEEEEEENEEEAAESPQ